MARRREAAEAEIDRLLALTLELVAEKAPAIPSVSEIVTAAGISNQTLYRSFPSKDDLIMAVLERGVQRGAERIGDRMAEEPDPRQRILVWVRGVLRQVSDPRSARTSRAVLRHLGLAGANTGSSEGELLRPITGLLVAPLKELGREPEHKAPYLSDLTLGMMRRHLWSNTEPTPDDAERLARFILRGLGIERT